MDSHLANIISLQYTSIQFHFYRLSQDRLPDILVETGSAVTVYSIDSLLGNFFKC